MPKNVWIALPAYTGQIHIGTFRSLLTDLLALHCRGDSFVVHDECGNTLLGDARALMVAKFLASDCTDMVFVDSDVTWESGTLLRLVDAPVDCVAAVYSHRNDLMTYPVSFDLSETELWANEAGLIKVWGVPMGCTRCSREMLTRMVNYYADLEFMCDPAPDKKAWALFDPYRKDKLKYSEDYSFCNRWRDIGGEIFVLPDVKMGHTGYKTFVGNLGEWLKSRA